VISDDSAEGQKQADQSREGATKDVLSGKEETIGSKDWQEKLVNLPGHLFRESDRLGAINIVKRIWHVAYLDEKYELKRSRVAFDSVPAIAASSWRRKLISKMREEEAVWHDFLDFASKAVATRHLEYFDIPKDAPDQEGRVDEHKWLDRVDAAVFHQSEWQRAISDESKREGDDRRAGAILVLTEALNALSKLQRPEHEGGLVGKPLSYIAILAMDGDSMGQWVSGAKSPNWREQLAEEAREYFEKSHPEAKSPDALKGLLDSPRHVSPSYHLQFSEALANFSLYLAAPIVEAFDGQLIYSGGDDVLAMLPAENALDCARALRMAFRGDPELCTVFGGALDVRLRDSENEPLPPDKQPGWGFVAVNGNWPGWQRWQRNAWPRGYHLLVPGKHADISAGIAIGHMHTPLQSLVEAARDAEKTAKRGKDGYGKSAFAVHLSKRSGERIHWGARWEEEAIRLADMFSRLTEDKKLSAKFPYALAANLRPYASAPHPTLEAGTQSFRIETVNGFDPQAVFAREFAYVLRKQSDDKWRKADPAVVKSLQILAESYLSDCKGRALDDFLGPFLTTTFIRKASD
jgi:CRISPR-associated protein Cas10/Cmr2 subtype III-B